MWPLSLCHIAESGGTSTLILTIKANELLCDMDLDKIPNPYDIQMSWKRFKSAFPDVMEQCILRSVLLARNNLPWLTKEIIQLIRRRNHRFKKGNHSGNRDDYLKFRQIRNRVVAELRLAKRRYFTNLDPHNQREFWKIVKSLTPKESSIPTLSSGNIVASNCCKY